MNTGENGTSGFRLFAAAMSVGIFAVPCALRATVLFSDNFSHDTATFAYPDFSKSHLPATPSGPGSWTYNYGTPEDLQAGVITNTLPGGGTGGADGNRNYFAMQRPVGDYIQWAAANFASAAGTSGNLSVQWDLYDVGPGSGFYIYLTDAAGVSAPYGNQGPQIIASYYTPVNSVDMELGALTPSFNDLGGYPDNAWVHMDMEVNLAAETYQFLVNGVSKGTFAYYQTTGPLKSLDFYSAYSDMATIFVDNISVVDTPLPAVVVPEPVTLSLLSLGSLFLFRRPRGRTR
jgi:hypothetical protein